MITEAVKFLNSKKRVEICEDFEEFEDLFDFQISEFIPEIVDFESIFKYIKDAKYEDYGPSGNKVARFIDYVDDDFSFSLEIASVKDISYDEKCSFDHYVRAYIADENLNVFVVNIACED